MLAKDVWNMIPTRDPMALENILGGTSIVFTNNILTNFQLKAPIPGLFKSYRKSIALPGFKHLLK
jgi:hypothetical protein